ncbi:class I tRNA ligase family protein [Halomicrobium salinisoli]|uniref:class I tRNA ligase family protein n=1 Tax=Halomicrobium salinisoli TaxID=2878391 RepID=UPI001CEFF743|nr:class I tRNA ligase family protein [Halomicrobium salinisoli]
MNGRFETFGRCVERQVQKEWRERSSRDCARVDGEDGDLLYFLDGPPNTSGKTHLGTVWNKVLKDAIVRTARLSGIRVVDRPGYDTHLFTTEQRLTDEEGLESAADVRDYGVEALEEACESREERFRDELESDFRDFGVWLDWERSYRTDSSSYADAAWQAFRRLYELGDAVEGEQVNYVCPECDLTLRKRAEVESEHLPLSDPPEGSTSPIYLAYPAADEQGAFVVRADEPWKVLCNSFLTVDPDAEYAKLSTEEFGDLYLATDTEEAGVPGDALDRASVRERVAGEQLVGTAYVHPLVDSAGIGSESDRRIFEVVASDRLDRPTGFGHGVPACDEASRQVAVDRCVAVPDPIADDGTIDWSVGDLGEESIFDVDERIRDLLRRRDALLRLGEQKERTKCCWLCGRAVVPQITQQWYISLGDRTEELFDAVSAVDWIPDEVEETMRSPESWHPDWSRDTRFDGDVAANQDWMIEQDAFWGLPIPVWESVDDPDDKIVLGSRAAIAERADQPLAPEDVVPRRSRLDDVTITEDGKRYRRSEAVFADRYSAALASVAVAGLEPGESMPDDPWPVDLIVEAKDQPGLWFFMQLATGVPLFGEMPFNRAFEHGFLTDENGAKMSKSVGNVVTPDEALERYAADPVRLYLLANTRPGSDISLDWDRIERIEAKLNTVVEASHDWGRMETAEATVEAPPSEAVVNDWLRARLDDTAEATADAISALDFATAVEEVLTFAHDTLATAYVPILRGLEDERGALSPATIECGARVFRETAKLLSPFGPHVAECLYLNADGTEPTVHACSWPGGREPAASWTTHE